MLADKTITAQQALEQSRQEFTGRQNAIQNDFTSRQAELVRQGQNTLQAREIASREAIVKLEQAGITNRFDQDQALKSSQFNIEQANTNARQVQENQNRLTQMGYAYELDAKKLPSSYAAQLSNMTLQNVNSLISDSNLSSTVDGNQPPGSSPKTRAIQNVIDYSNRQVAWANKFYEGEIPDFSNPAPTGSAAGNSSAAAGNSSAAAGNSSAAAFNPADILI